MEKKEKELYQGKKIQLPTRYNYVEVYLTNRCLFSCSYCINSDDFKQQDLRELTGEEWTKGLNRIQFGEVPITLGGGEPSLHEDFYKIINNLEQPVDLLTNLTFDVSEFMHRVKPSSFTRSEIENYHSIRASYHPGQTAEAEIIEKARTLQDGGFNIGIFGVSHPHFINENMKLAFNATKRGVHFYLKDYLGYVGEKLFGYYKYPEGLDGVEKKCLCRTKELLIAPDGDIHRCHRDLYNHENPLGNILDEDLTLEDKFRECDEFGECNFCDLKFKVNRFLNRVDCQVEIKDIK
ncbi:MAG: hypothetical protein KKF67_02295 [Nanoarchaeota archaeon]|nr:hypothetical protein [Nanoarchaeota archaeon]